MNVEEQSFAKEVGLFIVLFIVLIMVMAIFGTVLSITIGGKTVSTDISLFSFLPVALVIYLYATRIENRSWRSIGFSLGNALSSSVKGLIIGFVMFLAVVIIGLASGQFAFNGFDFSQLIYTIPIIIGYLIQSYGEEIYCRGWSLTYFSRRHGILFAILMSNIVFIVPHFLNNGIDLLSVINIFLTGCVFAVMFLRFDNIWVCGGAHAAWNISQGVLFGFNVSGIESVSLMKFSQVGHSIINGGEFGPESSLIATAVIVIALIIAVYWKSN